MVVALDPRGLLMNVREYMTARPITISGETDFKDAMGMMQKHCIRRLPVVDAAGALIGIVAERDLLVAGDRYLSSPVDVARIMTRQVVTIEDTAPLVEAAALLIERKIGGLPVIDASRRLLGIITETDLLKALTALLRQSEPKRRETPRRGGQAPARNKATVGKKVTLASHASKPKARLKRKRPRAGSEEKVGKRAGKR